MLGDKKESMKRRVELIMNRNKMASKIGTVAAVLASVILSGTTVFAYTPMQTTENGNSITTNTESLTFVENDSTDFSVDSQLHFIYPDGTIALLDDSNLEARAIFCSHNFKTGYVDTHNSTSTGGCIVYRYTGKICTKCNHIVIGDLVSKTTYVKCPHK